MNTREAFSRNLRMLMDKNVINQYQLAEQLGITASAVSSWVTGKRFPRPAVLEKLGTIFLMDATDLLKVPDDQEKNLDILNEDERKVIDLYASLPNDRKRMAIDLLEVIARNPR